MKNRIKWVAAGLVALIILVAVPLWYAKSNLESRYAQLSAKAESLGIKLTLPAQIHDRDAEGLREVIQEFDRREHNFEKLGIPIETDDPRKIKVVMADLEEILPTIFALTEAKHFGYEQQPPVMLESIASLMYLEVAARNAIADRNFPMLLKSATAVRKLAQLAPRNQIIPAMTVSILCRGYGSIIQSAAETFQRAEQISALIEEARQWKIHDFYSTATYLAADEFMNIDEDVARVHSEQSFLSAAESTLTANPTAVLQRKLEVLKVVIQLVPKWADDKLLLNAVNMNDASLGPAYFARFLKLRELDMRSALAGMWATLQGRMHVANGKPWPSISQLAALGIQAKDPVTGKAYAWREFEGKQRFIGTTHNDDGTSTEEYLLLSDAERLRDAKRRPKNTP